MLEQNNQNYDASQIQVLEGLEAVRKRPGMYIGSTSSRGLHHLVYEIVDNSIDEALAGYCKNIKVYIHKDNSVTVVDDGRGMPVGIHPKMGKPTVEVIMTVLHAGGKFGGGGYKVSGGLHGVGASVVNALSELCEVIVTRGGYVWKQSYKRGAVLTGLEKIGEAEGSGTKVHFKPDHEIFEETEYDFEILSQRLRELAFLNKGINITLIDEREDEVKEEVYHYEGGIKSFVSYLNRNKEVLHDEPIYVEGLKDGIAVEVSLQYHDGFNENIFTFANNIDTVEGGTHLAGFKTALTRVMNDYGRRFGHLKESDKNLSGDDIREGLTAVVSVKISEPQFEGQTKTKLGNNEAYTMMNDLAYTKFGHWIEDNKEVATMIINNALDAAARREKIKKINDAERKKIGKGTAPLAGKVAVCTLKNKEANEFIVVEGDSAGGSAKQARDRRFQTIMPSKGKIMNTEKQKLENVIASEELKIFNTAIGTGILDNYNEEDLKYDKIIIMSDADVDGYHIRTLWMTYIYRYMRPLIANGHLYLAQPPLYKVAKSGKGKDKILYAYSDDELEEVKKKVGKGATIQRFKGLGEMNPDQLWETTLNPETRTLVQVTIEDAAKAEKMVSLLMGDVVQPRKNYMYKYAEF
ncbi:MAG: DNA topoisomerase (ATP-hydrolyzing) subunit B [Clostridium perfringens]|nr:DNA topoisomerase (ATP-hydrolyzing) subunit B [Clostridium perfringens]